MKRLLRCKNILIWVLLLSIIGLGVRYSFKKPAPVTHIETVRVLESVRSPYFLPQYLALNLGYFKEQDLDVSITTTSQEAIRAALADGRTDIALCGLQKILFNPGAKGPQPKIFATLAGQDGSFLLARKDAEPFLWQNLKDKAIIGGSQDDSSEIALEESLRQQGQSPTRSVTIYHNIPETLRLGAFRAGTGNYIQLLEPAASLAEAKDYGRVAASVGISTGNMVVTAYAALPGYIESKPAIIQQFTNAIYKAQLWLGQHSSEEAAEVVAPLFVNVDRQVLITSIERYRTLGVWSSNPLIPRESYDKFQAAAKKSGEIASLTPYETAVITDFAQQAVETVVYVKEEPKPKKNLFQRLFK
ncbi:MAG: ABC transporter substrate-binding protein [Desulfotomaculaceae bacterium]|nr:ABC transporter substrate-binding protein [Desulfotomaculaceae bacterium]